MDIDSRLAVRPFRHHAGNERERFPVKHVRHALNGDGLDGRVGEDDDFITGRGGVALESGFHIGLEEAADVRQLAEKRADQFFRGFLVLATALRLAVAFAMVGIFALAWFLGEPATAP